ncbi:MAG: Acetyltransferase, GNAT family [uncultured Chloroflexi bacterium]|uniref:Acetyltransferase, GNAT family n=1 Tax=uncultured Chloroflexota bacterium TaxID=166587 RepID=A0A6J4KHU2_9CHLR|nr:MAG: Acetyltransferase, GNAT family [uncultured Chloroflexota bacterium]
MDLRQPVPEDVAARVEVPRDPEAQRMYGQSVPSGTTVFTPEEARESLASYARQDLTTTRSFVIAARVLPDGTPAVEEAGRYIGGIRLHSLSGADRRATLAIGIFDRRYWSKGYGTEAIRLLLSHAFGTMRLHRVALRVLEYNARAIRAYEKCGFTREGVERESAYVDGGWHSDVIMGILEREFRSLE